MPSDIAQSANIWFLSIVKNLMLKSTYRHTRCLSRQTKCEHECFGWIWWFWFQWVFVNIVHLYLNSNSKYLRMSTQMQHVWRWAHKRQMWICWWTFCMQSKSLNYETWEIKCTRRIFRTFECSEWMHSKVAPNVGDKVQTCFCVNGECCAQRSKSRIGKVKHTLWCFKRK